jgi:hypothetical protein
MFHANVTQVFSLHIRTFAKVFRFKLLASQKVVFFCQQLRDSSSLGAEIVSRSRSDSRALHKNSAIRIIVLNFAELTSLRALLSTRLSTFVCKTLQP